jgi:hypothetical protein
MNKSLKSWATPLACGAFTISAVTGLLIFFDIEMGLVEPVHKWLSWLLVTGVALHIISNWKQFTGYFSKKIGIGIIGASIVLVIASLLPIFGEDEEGEEKGNSGKIAALALESSSLETVALVIKASPQLLVAELEKSGITVKSPTLTIKEIARNNGKNEKEILGSILAQGKIDAAKEKDRD